MTQKTRAVLFDFDGTLADTAADLAAAVNRMLKEQGHAPLPLERLRPFSSAGARGMLAVAFRLKPDDPDYQLLRETFLEYYAERPCVHTKLFPGIPELLSELAKREIPWGVVTNKATRFTERILGDLKLEPPCVVCGDSTPHLKPHPAPMLLAAEQLHVPPEACVVLGDDLRDITAARAAGMRAIAVDWGYHHPEHGGPGTWNAEATIHHPKDLLKLL